MERTSRTSYATTWKAVAVASVAMCAHGSVPPSPVSASWSLLRGDLEAGCPSPVSESRSLCRDDLEAAGRGLAPALARTAAALTRVATGRGVLGVVGDRPWLRERLEAAVGERSRGERGDALGLKPPGLVLRPECRRGGPVLR